MPENELLSNELLENLKKKKRNEINIKLEKALKYLKEEYGINSIEELREDMKKTELDIGAFTMPFTIKHEMLDEIKKLEIG